MGYLPVPRGGVSLGCSCSPLRGCARTDGAAWCRTGRGAPCSWACPPGCEAVRRADETMQNTGLRIGVAGALHDLELRLRPGAMQIPCGRRWTRHVVAAVDDDSRGALQLAGVAEELSL